VASIQTKDEKDSSARLIELLDQLKAATLLPATEAMAAR